MSESEPKRKPKHLARTGDGKGVAVNRFDASQPPMTAEEHGVVIPHRPPHNGPPHILTQSMADRLITAAKRGVSRQAQARYAGIGLFTLYEWLRRGRAGDPIYAALTAAMDEREFDNEALLSESLIEQGRTNPIAAIGYLERRHPDRWGQKHQVEVKVKGEIESMLGYLREQIPADAFEHVIRALVAYSGDAPASALLPESDVMDAEFKPV